MAMSSTNRGLLTGAKNQFIENFLNSLLESQAQKKERDFQKSLKDEDRAFGLQREEADRQYRDRIRSEDLSREDKRFQASLSSAEADRAMKQKEADRRYGLEERELGLKGDQIANLRGYQDSQTKIEEMYKRGLLDESSKDRLTKETLARMEKTSRGAPAKEKIIPAGTADQLAFADLAEKQLGDLEVLFGKNKGDVGPIEGRLRSLNPWDTDTATLNAEADKAAQNIGKYLEGGKLAEGDIKRYRRMMPSNTDTPEVADNKIQNLKRLIATKRSADLDNLQRAGYETESFEQRGVPELATGKTARAAKGLLGSEAIAAPSVKEINGVKYRKVPGGWEAVE